MFMAERFQLAAGQFTAERTAVHVISVFRVRIIHAAERTDQLTGKLQHIVSTGDRAAAGEHDVGLGNSDIFGAVPVDRFSVFQFLQGVRRIQGVGIIFPVDNSNWNGKTIQDAFHPFLQVSVSHDGDAPSKSNRRNAG